jgi:hypothetical protein
LPEHKPDPKLKILPKTEIKQALERQMDKKKKEQMIAKSQERISSIEYSMLLKKKEEIEQRNKRMKELRMKEDFKFNNLNIIENKNKQIEVITS